MADIRQGGILVRAGGSGMSCAGVLMTFLSLEVFKNKPDDPLARWLKNSITGQANPPKPKILLNPRILWF